MNTLILIHGNFSAWLGINHIHTMHKSATSLIQYSILGKHVTPLMLSF
jgi:hypothetical protein